MADQKSFKQIYLRDNNLTSEIKQILINVMEKEEIVTASKASLHIIESYPNHLTELSELKNNLRIERDKVKVLENKLCKVKESIKLFFDQKSAFKSSEESLRNQV